MKAIVTGATGFLGRHLVSLLQERRFQVLALGRDRRKGADLQSANTMFKAVDITDMPALEDAFEQADIVFHCAALCSIWGPAEHFDRINVQGTRHVLACCEKYAVRRLVYVSSSSIYLDYRSQTDILESQGLAAHFANDYARTKYAGEVLLLAEKQNTEVVIIRPRGVIGEGDAVIMPRILRIADKGFFPLINKGRAIIDLSYVKNVAHALVLAGTTAGIDGRCFNITNLEPISVKTFLQKVLTHGERTCRFVPVNYHLIYHFANLLEFVAKNLSLGEPVITCYGVGLLANTQTLNVEAAKNELGYQPLYSLDEGIARYFKEEQRLLSSTG